MSFRSRCCPAHLPRVLGDSFLHLSDMHAIVECSEPLPEFPCGKFGAVEQQIDMRIADLIPDGATLQLGIGTIPDRGDVHFVVTEFGVA